MKVYLLRHGQDTLNKRGGWSNEPLTSSGVEQIKKAAHLLVDVKFDALLSSDLLRAVETAAILRSILSLDNVTYCRELREVNNGLLAGMGNKIAEERFPDLYWNTLKWDEKYPEGESPKEFYERIKQYWNRIIKENDNERSIMIVAHSGVFEVIQNLVYGTEYSNKKQRYKIKTGEFVVIELNKYD